MKKKIAFVIHSLGSGGAERVVTTLANGLVNNYSVTIITLIASAIHYKLDDEIKICSCQTTVKSNKNLFTPVRNNIILFKSVRNISKELNIDLLIGFTTTANILTILVAKSLKIPVIVSERIFPKYGSANKMWRFLRRVTYPKANQLIVQTEPIKSYFESFMSHNQITILANPISKSHTVAKNSLKVSKENIVLHVGRLTDQKGQEIAIEAFSLVNPLNWELHLVGEGYNRNKYLQLIEKMGMTEKIKLVGSHNNISNYYLKAKIFVFPSRFEGFPNALTEAMYFGLPCISTDCPTGPSELIENQKNGILTNVDDIHAFKDGLELLLKNSNLRTELGTKAAKSVEQYEEDKVLIAWTTLINKYI